MMGERGASRAATEGAIYCLRPGCGVIQERVLARADQSSICWMNEWRGDQRQRAKQRKRIR